MLSFSGERVGAVPLDLKSAPSETARAVVHRGLVAKQQNKHRDTASILTTADLGSSTALQGNLSLHNNYGENEDIIIGDGLEHGGIIGEDFGIAYYGELENGTQVVVKLWLQASPQGAMEFLAELCVAGTELNRSSQRNLVSLIGYCNEGIGVDDQSKAGLRIGLTWKERLHIAFEAAQDFGLPQHFPQPIWHSCLHNGYVDPQYHVGQMT
ncbi:hypothetical protein OPV22_003036 [Ensete ventricosum]|uniref:Protein kinase domain-containing protein n=1 Tax=Ensete ventricosum TaxID=4639 RepID=A0AAV8RZR6_ENSVE|nr:hypothetical protein OPV22_003036 [Ensete ventricosum]